MGLGYYGAWLLYGFTLSGDIVTYEDGELYINHKPYENDDEMISIHGFGDDDTDGYFLAWGKDKSFRGGGMWDDGGQISFSAIKEINDGYDESRMKQFCQKYGIVYVAPTFNILMSNGQVKY